MTNAVPVNRGLAIAILQNIIAIAILQNIFNSSIANHKNVAQRIAETFGDRYP